MDYQYRLTERAILDARLIFGRIANYSPARGEKWYRGLIDRFDSLRIFPFRCPRAPESEQFGEDVRHLLYGKRQSAYRILFVVRDDVVVILAIWHASRGPAEL